MQDNYEDPLEFKPWRFSEKETQEGEGIHQYDMATLSLDFVFFGNGRPAWCVQVKLSEISSGRHICVQSGTVFRCQRVESSHVLRSPELWRETWQVPHVSVDCWNSDAKSEQQGVVQEARTYPVKQLSIEELRNSGYVVPVPVWMYDVSCA